MSHCEWRPIDHQIESLGGIIWVFHNGDLTEAVWGKEGVGSELSWNEMEYIPNFGTVYYLLNPQPKYYLAVTPPPEE